MLSISQYIKHITTIVAATFVACAAMAQPNAAQVSAPVVSQQADTVAVSTPGDTIISLATIHPGPEIFQLEGHTALIVRLPGQPAIAVNYGVFDFNSPHFVYRFLKGQTDYMCVAEPWDLLAHYYKTENRRIVEQYLDLSPDQKQRLILALQENLRPENATYRYNYVKNNCATRPLEMVQNVLDAEIDYSDPTAFDPEKVHSFRRIMNFYHTNYPWYQFGIDLLLGPGVDYAVSAEERNFAPVVLEQQLTGATVNGRPLVFDTQVLNDVPSQNVVLEATPWYLTPLFVFSLMLAIVVLVCAYDLRRRNISRWLSALVYTALGVAGIIVAFIFFISHHEATTPNYLILWINPLCFIAGIGILIRRYSEIIFYYQLLNLIILVAMVVIWPLSGQEANWAIIPVYLSDVLLSFSYIYIYYHK